MRCTPVVSGSPNLRDSYIGRYRGKVVAFGLKKISGSLFAINCIPSKYCLFLEL